MSKTLGVRFDQDCLVAAVVDAAGSRPKLCEVLIERGVGKQRAMKDFVARHRLDPYRVSVSLPAYGNCLCKFSVRLTDEEEIAQVVHYESEPHMTTHPIDDLVVDSHILKSGPERTRLLVGAAKKAVVERTLSFCEDSGIFPMSLEMDIAALYHAARFAGIGREDPALILDVHRRFCNMLLIEQGNISDARCLRLRIDSVGEGMLADLDDTVEIALDRNSPAPITPEIQERIFERPGKELQRAVFENSPRMHVCGNEELAQSLPEFLRKRHGLAVEPWPPEYVEVAGHIPDAFLPRVHPAVGLALKAAGRTKGGYNFRKGEFRHRQGFEIWQKPLAAALTLLFLLLAGGILHRSKPLGEIRHAYRQLGLRADEIHARTGLKEELPGKTPVDRLGFLKCAMEERIRNGDRIPAPRSALSMWKDAMRTVSGLGSEHPCTVESIVVKRGEVWLEGRVESLVCFDAWMREFKKLPWVSRKDGGVSLFSSEETKRPENGRLSLKYRFRIQAE